MPSRVTLLIATAATNGQTSANFACIKHFGSKFVNQELKAQVSMKHPRIDLSQGFT